MKLRLSRYARKFDENSTRWTKDKMFNKAYLLVIEDQCNEVLKERGYLFLRDVYEKLGIPLTKESIVCGWIYEEDNPIGDNYVDFIICETEGSDFYVDFNIDGNILDRITKF